MAETAARIGPSNPPAVLPVPTTALPAPPAALPAPTAALPAPPAVLPVPTAEVRALAAVQRAARGPAMVRVALGMSLFGEHAAGWLAIGTIGVLADRPRRRQWLTASLTVAVAHGVSVGVKRVVRRPRPDHPHVQVLAGTPSGLSFPSAHATSTTAAAILFGALLHRPLVALLVPPMALSRLVLGVHYPTDVLAGSALGAAVVVAARRIGRAAIG